MRAAARAWGKARRAIGLEGPLAPLQQEGSGCSARLDADALEGLVAGGPAWDGVRETLRDVWRGQKEDPRKVRSGAVEDPTVCHIAAGTSLPVHAESQCCSTRSSDESISCQPQSSSSSG